MTLNVVEKSSGRGGEELWSRWLVEEDAVMIPPKGVFLDSQC